MAKVPQSVQYIKDVFDAADIDRVWEYLGKTFGFNISAWKEEFQTALGHFPRNTSVQEAFMTFGKQKIEPLLNEILKRKRHPAWIELLTFVLKDKIDEREKRDAYYKDRYE